MVDERLISRCGIYCGACYIYRAERDGGKLLKEMARRFKVTETEIKCNGCSSPYEEQWTNCQRCGFKTCQKKRGLENCAQCREFSKCPEYGYIVDFSMYRGEDARESLKVIESGDSESWLIKQEKHWSCPSCGAPLMWYDNECRRCGMTIRKEEITIDGFNSHSGS